MLAALAAPAGASAAALAPLRDCYVSVAPGEGERVTVRATGFAPGATVDVALDGRVVLPGVSVDEAGTMPAEGVAAPFVRRGARRFAVTVTDRAQPWSRATRSARVVALRVRLGAVRGRSARWRASGFTRDGPLFAHYARRGRVRATVRVADPRGACGTVSVRRRVLPRGLPRGTWTVQVDQERRFRRLPDGPFVRLRLRGAG